MKIRVRKDKEDKGEFRGLLLSFLLVFGGGRPDAAVQGASAVDGDRLHERGLLNL